MELSNSADKQKSSPGLIQAFQKKVWDFYVKNKRDLPWRFYEDSRVNPYYIFLSEIMLQQTQVPRVRIKFAEWLEKFPSLVDVARAPQTEILATWMGLGYNRRALFLQKSCQKIEAEYGGVFPNLWQELDALPGVGEYTAKAVATFIYNTPHVYIETNIRSVFIYEFFREEAKVRKISDVEIMPFIESSVDRENPREWYYALMDYGSHLKKTIQNPSRASRLHSTQSKFVGSFRQKRAAVLRLLLEKKQNEKICTFDDLAAFLLLKFQSNEDTAGEILAALEKDGFIVVKNSEIMLL